MHREDFLCAVLRDVVYLLDLSEVKDVGDYTFILVHGANIE